MRSAHERRINTTFSKKNGDQVYYFHHLRTEILGAVFVKCTVRVKPQGAPKNHVGKLVHHLFWQQDIEEQQA